MTHLTSRHNRIEKNGGWLTVLITIAVSIGGIVEIVFPLILHPVVPQSNSIHPYTALELAGRDIYIREGCSGCHSQMIRPFYWEAVRFSLGIDPECAYSNADEYRYDRPFLWGSKRTGPDLWRESTMHNEDWHYLHFLDPTSERKDTTMPAYPWLYSSFIDADEIILRMETLNFFDTYSEHPSMIMNARSELHGRREIDALVAYMMRLGRDHAQSCMKKKLEEYGQVKSPQGLRK